MQNSSGFLGYTVSGIFFWLFELYFRQAMISFGGSSLFVSGHTKFHNSTIGKMSMIHMLQVLTDSFIGNLLFEFDVAIEG